MSLPIPILDDRRFEELFEEARGIATRVDPEWTDHNESDPGIALMQLFAWITDARIYQVGRLAPALIESLARVVGLTRRPPSPAQVWLAADASGRYARGTTLAPVVDGGPWLELVRETWIDRARPVAIIVDSAGAGRLEVSGSSTDRSLEPRSPVPLLGPSAAAGDSFTIELDRPCTNRALTLALVLATERGQTQLGAPAGVALRWEVQQNAAWVPAENVDDGTRSMTSSGLVHLEGVEGCDALRCTIVEGRLPYVPRLRSLHLDRLEARQVQHRATSHTSPGIPSFECAAFDPSLEQLLEGAALRAFVGEGGGSASASEEAARVERFDESGPDDLHFVVDPARGTVRFGNGRNGALPPKGSTIDVRVATTMGARAEHALGDTWRSLGGGPSGAVLRSVLVTHGGTDRESIDALARRVRNELGRPRRAVTSTDHVALALRTPGGRVARAAVAPRSHPRFAPRTIEGSTTVVVVSAAAPGRRLEREHPAFLSEVAEHLGRRRVAGERIAVVGPRYVPVALDARIFLDERANEAEVVAQAIDALDLFLDAVVGGDDGHGWPLGRDVGVSDLVACVDRIPGIAWIEGAAVHAGSVPSAGLESVALGPLELPSSGDHTITFAGRIGDVRRTSTGGGR